MNECKINDLELQELFGFARFSRFSFPAEYTLVIVSAKLSLSLTVCLVFSRCMSPRFTLTSLLKLQDTWVSRKELLVVYSVDSVIYFLDSSFPVVTLPSFLRLHHHFLAQLLQQTAHSFSSYPVSSNTGRRLNTEREEEEEEEREREQHGSPIILDIKTFWVKKSTKETSDRNPRRIREESKENPEEEQVKE